MLAADKLQLQSALKQQATALKEKEFNLHHSNLMTVGTQAAVLAGLDITMFIEFNPPADHTWEMGEEWKAWVPRIIKFWYYVAIVAAFCANMMVVSHTTALSVLGAGMALRGPDGSMMTATDGLYEERKVVFHAFSIGLAATVGSVVLCVWLILRWEAAFVCMSVTAYTCYRIWANYKRVYQRFSFDESETVDFTDIMEGPAAIQAIPSSHGFQNGKYYPAAGGVVGSRKKKKPHHQHHHRQQRPRRPSPSGNTSQSSLSLTNNSHQNSLADRLRNRLTSFSSGDASNGGSISSSYGDEEDLGGTVEEIELQPMIVDGGSSSANIKRRGNARSQQIPQPQPAPNSMSHRINSKKEDDAYNIQTV